MVTGHFGPKIVHKMLWTQCQRFLRHFGHRNTSTYDRSCALSYKLCVQTLRYEFYGSKMSLWVTMVCRLAFPVSSANLWNRLPAHLTSAPSLTIFWQCLKTFLFQPSYTDLIFRHSELMSYCEPSSDCIIICPIAIA